MKLGEGKPESHPQPPLPVVSDDMLTVPGAQAEWPTISDDMLAAPGGSLPAGPHEGRMDFEAGLSYAAPLTLLLVAANIAVFIWQAASGSLENIESLVASGALYRPKVMEGEAWRLGTSVFLHAGPDHLFGNCVALYILGIACEHAYGFWRSLAVYAFAGIAGSIASMAINPDPTVGASGAVFGIMGCVVAMFHLHKHRLFLRDTRIGFVLLIWALYQIATGFLDPRIANLAHVGGFVAGGAMATLISPIGFVRPKATAQK